MSVAELEQQLDTFRAGFDAVRDEIERVIVGQAEAIQGVLIALIAGGHVLLKGPPGSGKTLLARTLSGALELEFRRIQFTPDMMPADVIGTYIVMESSGRRKFEFQQGPVFTNVLLADEINRATPKTQSALLEALAEFAVTVANETYDLPDPFFVVATQSEDEGEGTFPLPAKQLDRFLLALDLQFPNEDQMEVILQRTTESETPAAQTVLSAERLAEMTSLARQVPVADEIRKMAIRLVAATHPENESAPAQVKDYVGRGCSPRGAQALILAAKVRAVTEGRVHVALDDLKTLVVPALAHRLVLNFDGHAENISPAAIVNEILRSVAP